MVSSVKRGARFVLLVFFSFQYVVLIAVTARSAHGLPPILRNMFAAFETLMFADMTIPPECTDAPPFATERAQLITVIVLFVLFGVMAVAWAPLAKRCSLGGSCNTFQQSRTAPHCLTIRPTKVRLREFMQRIAMYAMDPVSYRRLLALLIQITFAMVCRTALRVIRCEEDILLSVPAYLRLKNDGSSLRRAGLSCGFTDPLCRKGATSNLAYRQIYVSVAKWYPDHVCSEADHKSARRLAIAALVLVCFLYVILSFVLVEWRMSLLFRNAASEMSHKRFRGECAVRAPCAFIRQTAATEHSKNSRKEKAAKRSNMIRTTSKKWLSIVWNAMTGRRLRMKPESIARNVPVGILDFVDESLDVAKDRYISSFVDAEYVPSLFYFLHLGFVTRILLRFTVTYWDEPSDAYRRCLSNMLIICAIGLVVFFSRPYRPRQGYGQFLQLSFLGVAFMVTLVDLIGSAGTDVDPLDPSNYTASRATHNAVLFFGYLALFCLVIMAFSLLALFFHVLMHGAREDRESALKKSDTYVTMGLEPVPPLRMQAQGIQETLLDQTGLVGVPSKKKDNTLFHANPMLKPAQRSNESRQTRDAGISEQDALPNIVVDTEASNGKAPSSLLQTQEQPRATSARPPSTLSLTPISPFTPKKPQGSFAPLPLTKAASFYGPRASIIPGKQTG
jgi:hypothetical protein